MTPKQTELPRSWDLCNEVLHIPVTPDPTLHSLPLSQLQSVIQDTQRRLMQLTHEYDYRWLCEQEKLRELTRRESDKLRAIQRERKVEKERAKIAKGLRGNDRKYYKQTGKTPSEAFEELMSEFISLTAQKAKELIQSEDK